LGERARFVGTDDRRGAQRLDRRQAADQRVALDHFLHAQGQADRHHGGQPFRDRRDRQPDRDHEHLQRSVAAQPADQKHQRADHQGRRAQRPAQLIQPALQGSLLPIHRLQHLRDQADLGVHAGADDQSPAATVIDQRAHEGRVFLVAQRDVLLEVDVGVFFGGGGLAGERRFVDAQVHRLHQPHIGGHKVAGFEQDQIAGHESG